ncbi:MAG: hypothetical protein K6E79_05410 [Pseudobutyrivibrio sp.]|nr:hypothetical protein [Pseudobutyrivibrio sp.]
MTTNCNLTEEQINKIHQLDFFYKEASRDFSVATNNELYTRVMTLDATLKARALTLSISDGIAGGLLLITGYNFLTMINREFLPGIIFFSIGAILLAGAYPLYNYSLQKNRKKFAPVVLTVTKLLG